MNPAGSSRRNFLRLASTVGLGLTAGKAMAAHDPFGPINPPQPAPALWLIKDDGVQTELLRQHLTGRTTAVQLMFTKCRATCPIQGALFAAVARKIRDVDVQFLSLSIDPAIDKPAALRKWLDGFSPSVAWRAVAPRLQDVDRMFDFFQGRADGADRHSAAVYVLNRKGQLAFRTAGLPAVGHVVDVQNAVAKRG